MGGHYTKYEERRCFVTLFINNNKMTNTVIPLGGNVQGDITSCKIETAKVSISKNGAFSVFQESNYQSYDVCTKEVVAEYVVPEFTGFGIATPFIAILLILTILVAWGGGSSY